MSNRVSLGTALLWVPLAGLTQTAHGQMADAKLEEIVITGSHIAVAANAQATPVSVLTSDDLVAKGSLSPVELTKSLPYVTGSVSGDNNFTNGLQRNSGAANLNLRGLSSGGGNERTLVLFNSQRFAGNNQAPDLNTLPLAAIGRIETLKMGGSTVYGSDAEAGVVNFITSRTLNGFDVAGDYSQIKDSAGNWNGHVNWGNVFTRGNVLLSAGYNHTSELSTLDRDWARTSILVNPTQQWINASNIGTYTIATTTGGQAGAFTDPGCEGLGGVLSPANQSTQSPAPICYISRIPFQNIIDKVDRGQLYGELNFKLTDRLEWHTDAWIGMTNNDHVHAAPQDRAAANFPTLTSTGGTLNGRRAGNTTIPALASAYYIPANNPGLAALLNTYSAAQLGLTTTVYNSARTSGVNSGSGWTPLNLGSESAQQRIRYRSYRLSSGLTGELDWMSGMEWKVNGVWSQFDTTSTNQSTLTQRVQLALRGLGGANCTGSTPGANGCQFFNPFSNAYPDNPVLGLTNPNYGGAALANDPALIRWMLDPNAQRSLTTVTTAEAGLTGDVPGFSLPGGAVDYALGVQYRRQHFFSKGLGNADPDIHPCTDEGISADNCPRNTNGVSVPQIVGGYTVGSVTAATENMQESVGTYLELHLPVLKSLDINAAGRYEKADSVSVASPKLSVRWQPMDFLTLRASGERTFKVPTSVMTNPAPVGSATAVVGANRVSTFTSGDPDLRAETTNATSFGVLLSGFDNRLQASVDFWRYVINDNFVTEQSGSLVSALFPNGTGAPIGNCNNPQYAEIQSRFRFALGDQSCNINNVSAIYLNWINGSSFETRGVDIDLSYAFDLFGGRWRASSTATRLFKFQAAEQPFFGIAPTTPSYNQVGYLNTGVYTFAAPPIPEWRVDANLSYSVGVHVFRWMSHYVSGIEDNRFTMVSGANNPTAPIVGFNGYSATGGQFIHSSLLHDFGYGYTAPDQTQFNVTVTNVFDQDPPFVRYDMNYMATIGSPLGRVVRVSVGRRF